MRGNERSELEPTAWGLLEDVRLVVPVYGRFSVLKHLFIFFLLRFAMTRRLGPIHNK